ncbi:MAG TPA: IS110 family transposase [Steroidobacteraceae bacterium]|jgi:transposase
MTSSHCIETLAAWPQHGTLFVAFELAKGRWKLGLASPGGRLSRHTLEGGDAEGALQLIVKARTKLERQLNRAIPVVSCYEAGYDGFWLHRWLVAHGVDNRVLDPASIQVNRRKRRAKTDRLDLEQLVAALMRYCWGDRFACKVVHVPSSEQEDDRRPSRERERLVNERTQHINRLKGLLHGQGVRDALPRAQQFCDWLGTVRTGDGRALASHLMAELKREHARLMLAEDQIVEIESQAEARRQAAAKGSIGAKITQLIELKSLGPVSSNTLIHEVFFRDFKNRRQVGSYIGLTGTPFDSGGSEREQGISKAGNARARTAAIELAWIWRRYQPTSALSRWFETRVGDQKGRARRIAIVALARKLMVALWRFLEHGVVPEGAILRAAPRG